MTGSDSGNSNGDIENDSEPMDMSSPEAGSDQSSEAAFPTDGGLRLDGQTDNEVISKKRKLSVTNGVGAHDTLGAGMEMKRARTIEPPETTVAKDMSFTWPNGLWQKVFLQQPPAMLYRLSRVNKRFKYLLENAKDLKVPARRGALAVQQIDSETIWTHSRRAAYPSMPRPLPGLSEAAMIRVVTAQSCQNCLKRYPPVPLAGPLNSGPGVNGVRPLWQFKRALCGGCLKDLSMTDVEVFKLRSELRASDLKKGLTFVFLTKDLHVVSELVARQNPNLGIVKVYLRSDVDDVLDDFKEAQAFGGGAQEEWVKGLEDVGKAAAADALRWQRWEDQLPSGTYLPMHMLKLDPVSFGTAARSTARPEPPHVARAPITVSTSQQQLPAKHTVHPLPKPVHSITFSNNPDGHIANPAAIRDGPTTPAKVSVNQTATTPVRLPRNANEAQQAIRERRSEIERRAKLLVPAIEPDVLAFMESFKAAILIGVPFTDADWQRLQPRLEAEREHAEQLHYEQVQTFAALHAANPINWQYPQGVLAQSKDSDREWEASQGSLREVLGFFADEVINGTWRAQPLTRELVPYFAADVLTGVQERYRKHSQAKQTAGVPETGFLSLDAMKWVFENKIKALAEPHSKEMFLCAGCNEEHITKWLAFEGLIQHYGAKHTTDFSKGNITVHWQTAEWTDEPPFVTDISILYPKHRKPAHLSHPVGNKRTPTRPSSEMMLSSNPLFAAQELSQPGVSLFNEDAALLKIGFVGRNIWSVLARVRGLSDVIKVITVLSHIVQDFLAFHGYQLPLDLLIKAVTINEKDSFDELRAVNSLTCRFCSPTSEQSPDTSEWIRLKSLKKQYKLTNLLNHFQIAHVQKGVAEIEWQNVIDIPEPSEIIDLMKTPGMNDEKLVIIDKAWPAILPKPLPEIGEVPSPPPDSGLARRLVMKGLGQPSNKSKKKKSNSAREYNPNDAMIPPKPASGPVDLSAFDTDPPPSAPITGNEAALGQLSLAPETLAALQSLSRDVAPWQLASLLQQAQLPQGQPPAQSVSPVPSARASPDTSIFASPAVTQAVHQSAASSFEAAPIAAETDPNISAIIASLRQGINQPPRDPQPYQPPAQPSRNEQSYLPQQPYGSPAQPSRNEQSYLPQPPMRTEQQYAQHYQPQPPQAYQTQPPQPSVYQMPPEYHHNYSQPLYQQAAAAPPQVQMQQLPYSHMTVSQPWGAPPQAMPPQQPPFYSGYNAPQPPQMQPVPGNPRLMYDPRTGQYYELVPDEY